MISIFKGLWFMKGTFSQIMCGSLSLSSIMCGSRGGDTYSGSVPHLKNHKNVRFLSNSGVDPLKNHKATNIVPSQHSTWANNGTPAKSHLNGVLLAGKWWPAYLDPSSPHQPKNNNKKTPSKLDPLWQNFLDQRMVALYFCLPRSFQYEPGSHHIPQPATYGIWEQQCLWQAWAMQSSLLPHTIISLLAPLD